MARKRANRDTGFLWSEPGEQKEGVIAEVAPLIQVDHTFSFAVPAAMESAVIVGRRVTVPMGRRGRLVTGFVVGLDRREWESTLRPVAGVLDDDGFSFLTAELVELGREISAHYACPLGRTLAAMTPEAARAGAGMARVRYAQLADNASAAATSSRAGAKQRALLERLAAAKGPLRVEVLLAETGASAAVLRSLAKKGIVSVTVRREAIAGEPTIQRQLSEPGFELTTEQRDALAAVQAEIDHRRFSVTLLYGVSGSGKTEIYIRAMQQVLAKGGSAMLLVPEIMLTTQLVARLSERFSAVAVHHSGLTAVERSQVWRRIADGTARVVIGTRSAVFAPARNLGLICVDEEQESSYKNLQAPRFHVRDVAIMRAHRLGIPVILGSATPSVETWHHSESRADYRRLVLTRRVNDRPLPPVGIIDMVEEAVKLKYFPALAPRLEGLLAETLDRGGQALLLVNRRGFATCLYCPVCRTRLTCPNCKVSLVVHRARGEALCHYCHTRVVIPTVCPTVGCGATLLQTGVGTQRVEQRLAELFPDRRIERVDSDTMRHRAEYRRVVDEFEARRIDMLVGTQMIAKGLDFPGVSLVGIVHADAAGLSADFRAQERLFQLVTQMAGRAGRADTPGEVIVQTTTPSLPALRHAASHDYASFAADELRARRHVGLPPFRRLARFVLSHAREETARREAEALADRVRDAVAALSLRDADVWGPNPCALARLRGKYRYDLLVRTQDASSLRRLIGELQFRGALRTKAESTIVDVDPVTMV